MKVITLTLVAIATLATSNTAFAQNSGFEKSFPKSESFQKPQPVRGNSVSVLPNPNGGIMGQVNTPKSTTTYGHNKRHGATATSINHTRNNGRGVGIGVTTNRKGVSGGSVSVAIPTR